MSYQDRAVKMTTWIEKATWWGCGNHIPSVMDSISEDERCTCGPKRNVDGKEYPPKAGEAAKS